MAHLNLLRCIHLQKHNSLVDIIENRLNNKGYDIHKYETYCSRKGCGEIDLYAIKDNYVLLFEIKSSEKRYTKAIEQLERAEKCCFKNYRVFKFFVYYKNNDKGYGVDYVK